MLLPTGFEAAGIRGPDGRTGVPPSVAVDWRVKLDGALTAPVAAGGRLFVARSDAHTVYALDMASGELVWRFLAAPTDRRVACFDQIESAWPVHGSVLVHDDAAYFTGSSGSQIDPVGGGLRLVECLFGAAGVDLTAGCRQLLGNIFEIGSPRILGHLGRA